MISAVEYPGVPQDPNTIGIAMDITLVIATRADTSRSAVNRRVVGSSPTRGARTKFPIADTALEDTPLSGAALPTGTSK